ncbi:Antirestriction protein ArdC [Segatella oulorum]|uniref:Antirestriction protein ArdC n=1 Tax=Segatella oulorum TaxID=28136 RepID=A0A1T4P118_9BACT|nr:ArdC-like ssDNA-binding domain-containing protein [Segatella oulorum]SJZ84946.1 Antirestriction protein ArdC [Segatella oulorum]
MAETEYKQRNSSSGRKNKSDEILKKFAGMMVKIIKKANANNWKKGWMGVNGSIQGLPQNISGRTYSGGNSFFLMFNTAEKGYKTPVYMTFKQAKEQNLHVKSGEKSVPIFKWGLSIKDENGKKVSEEDYNAMSQEERATMDVRPFPKMFHVFNIDQTNLEEVNKKRYDAIVARFKTPEQEVKDTEGMYVNEALDRMFEQKAWHANIQYDKPADQAFYSPSTDSIVLPMKEQFKLGKTPEEVYHDGMEYYSTALHEMAHSTGHESRLDRKFGAQGTDNYAHEELIAEMTSALVGSTMGFDRKILENNANYLSGWLNRLRDKPETITTIMTDVGKASDMIIEKVDEQRIALNQTPLKAGNLEGLADDYDDPSEALAKGIGMEESKEDATENISLSEDSNPQTDLAGVAEHIMETNHVSKGEAEKMAAPIVEEQQTAVNEKKQKAAQAKQEAVKKADEARKAEDERRREVEEQRRREEENRKNDKDGGQASKIFLHAALLLGALELAKGNKGVWMNKAGKSNAEFLWAKTPITPYNNLMMNLQSDQKGYRSNVYAYFDELKDAGDSVRSNEKALPFNWTRWDYQNIATKEVITKGEYQKLPEDERSLYVKHHSRQTQQIFNIDQTSMTGKQMYSDLLKETGAKYEELSERGVTSMIKFSEKLKSNHPTAIVVARDDNQYQIYGNDATRAGKILGLPVGQTEVDGQKIKSTGFPLDRIDDYLPKLVQAKQWVVVADNLDSAELIRRVANEKDVLNKAYSTAQTVAKSAGIGYERVMVLQDAEYDKQADKIIVSGMTDKDSGNSRQTAIAKANDIYRAIVAATGSEQRLDRLGRNNLLPNDDAKYERFVQDLSAGILMARQGLPASLSKESMQHIDYWQREIKENPKLLGLLEKDVNNAVESIDKHLQKQIVKYEDIRKDLPLKDLAVSERQYQISTDLAKLPDIDSKEIVIVRDTAKGSADVILPEGASLEDNVEISGIRKDRIKIALGHEGITDVKFYNAGGALGLKEPDDYYKDKTVSVDRLRQYEFSQHRDIDVKPQIAAAALPKIEIFTPIRDEKGQYAFFFKAENEPSFSVYPNDTHKKLYFDVRGTDKQKEIHDALAQKYYSVAKQHPEIKVDLIMPKVSNVDMSKIERPTITKDKEDPNKKYVMATIDGKFMKKEISKAQWDKMWLADDMSAYKKAVAAVVFAPLLKEDVQKEQSTSMAARSTSTETVKKEQGAEEKTSEGTSESISETATGKEAETTRRESTFRR